MGRNIILGNFPESNRAAGHGHRLDLLGLGLGLTLGQRVQALGHYLVKGGRLGPGFGERNGVLPARRAKPHFSQLAAGRVAEQPEGGFVRPHQQIQLAAIAIPSRLSTLDLQSGQRLRARRHPATFV